jgi:hypothetical protein
MQYRIFKTLNKLNGKFYIGKEHIPKPIEKYFGSGENIKKAVKKHGLENFKKIILESKLTAKQADKLEDKWILKTGALGNQGYNMARGGTGGDRSKFIPYDKMDYSRNDLTGIKRYWANLTPAQKKAQYLKQAQSRCKTYYISPVDEPDNETKVYNLKQWCEKNGYHVTNFHNRINPNHRLYGKQHKGLRIRMEGQPKLAPYEDRRGQNQSDFCKGKTWQLRNGKREWITV